MQLDVFSPRKKKEPKPVLIFIHGGSWRSGQKSLYKFFGKGLARKGLVGVIIDYRLSPVTNYEGMAMDAAEAVKWVKQNISSYGGDSTKIFVSGHSAGAQMAALIATDNRFFDSLKISNPIKGTVLIDAFGLDMFSYLSRYKSATFSAVFSEDTANWKKGSPIYHLDKGMPPFIMYLGDRTYPEVTKGSNEFFAELKKFQPDAQLILNKRKRHETMIFQFYQQRNKNYSTILEFMKK
jgi:acetyl esterase/lipase